MRITLIDDEKDILLLIGQFLKNLGHTVYAYTSAKEALQELPAKGSQLVVSDVIMPGMSGFDMMRTIQRDPNLGHVDVVLITGYGEVKEAVRAMREGAYDYLQKPVDLSELMALVNRISERRRLMQNTLFDSTSIVKPDEVLPDDSSAQFSLDKAILRTVQRALNMCGGNKSRAARYLDIPRNRLYNYIKRIEQLDEEE